MNRGGIPIITDNFLVWFRFPLMIITFNLFITNKSSWTVCAPYSGVNRCFVSPWGVRSQTSRWTASLRTWQPRRSCCSGPRRWQRTTRASAATTSPPAGGTASSSTPSSTGTSKCLTAYTDEGLHRCFCCSQEVTMNCWTHNGLYCTLTALIKHHAWAADYSSDLPAVRLLVITFNHAYVAFHLTRGNEGRNRALAHYQFFNYLLQVKTYNPWIPLQSLRLNTRMVYIYTVDYHVLLIKPFVI